MPKSFAGKLNKFQPLERLQEPSNSPSCEDTSGEKLKLPPKPNKINLWGNGGKRQGQDVKIAHFMLTNGDRLGGK